MSCEGGVCTCGCTPHSADCPAYGELVGPDVDTGQGDGCAPGPYNAPTLSILCGLGDAVHQLADLGGKLKADMGLVPYRVFLVWERHVEDGRYVDVRRVELMPVEVVGLADTQLSIGAGGVRPEGAIALRRVSPRQVTQDDLLGKLEGRAFDGDGERFFYDIVQHPRCAGKAMPMRWRYTILGLPELRTSRAPVGYVVNLIAQSVSRGRHGEDRTTSTGEQPDRAKWAAVRG